MTRAQRRVNLAAVSLPFVGVVVAIPLLWNSWVSALDLALFAVFYLLTGFGITVGFHRLLTHRALATSKPVEVIFAVLGSMAIEGPVAARGPADELGQRDELAAGAVERGGGQLG